MWPIYQKPQKYFKKNGDLVIIKQKKPGFNFEKLKKSVVETNKMYAIHYGTREMKPKEKSSSETDS